MNDFFVKAKPIWATGEGNVKNLSLKFTLNLKDEEAVTLKLTACNFYRIVFNGQFVGYGPARGAHGHYRVDEYNLNCKKGGSVLEIIVAGYRCNSFYGVNEQPFLIAEVNGKRVYYTAKDGDFSCTSTSRIVKTPRYSYQRTFTECYDYSLAETIKNLEEIGGGVYSERYVSYPVYPNETGAEVETGTFTTDDTLPVFNSRFLEKESIELYKLSELEFNPNEFLCKAVYKKSPVKHELNSVLLNANNYAVYDLGKIYSGFIGVDLYAKEESEVYIIFEEIDANDGKGNSEIDLKFYRNDTLNFIALKGVKGEKSFISFEPYSARYIKVLVVNGSVKLNGVYMKKYENPDADLFNLRCDDAELEEIIEAAKNTFKQNAVDVLTDCPGRERAGWLCDSYFTSFAEKLLTGDNKVERNFLENYAENEYQGLLPDGMIGMCYPADFEDGLYIPNWAMWYIVELESYLKRTKDPTLIEKSKNKVYGLIKFFEKYENEYSLLENLESWVFIEWSPAGGDDYIKGVSFPSNMLYCLALKSAAAIYNDNALNEKAEKIKSAVLKLSFDGEFFRDNAIRENGVLKTTDNVSEICQYYAFYSGIASFEEHKDLWQKLLVEFGPERNENETYPNVVKSVVFIGNYLRLFLMMQMGEKQKILSDCKDLFLPMARKTGTLWEHGGTNASLNHGFASVAVNLISYALGNGGF